MKTVRTECTDHFVIFGLPHLTHLLKEFVRYYQVERYHRIRSVEAVLEGSVV